MRTPTGLHCHDCERDVVDLSHVTYTAYERLRERVRRGGERICVRAVADVNGDVTFAPDFVALDRLRRRARPIALGAVLVVTGCDAEVATHRTETPVTVPSTKRYGDASLAGALGVARRAAPYAPPPPPRAMLRREDAACRMHRLFGDRCGDEESVIAGGLY